MNYLLFFLNLILGSWWLISNRFVLASGLAKPWIIGIFWLKILVGIVHLKLLLHINPYPDTMIFHLEGLKEYHLLFSDPGTYFTNLFHSPYTHGYAGLMESQQSFWNDLTSNLVSKLLSVFDLFTSGNYYGNLVWFNALTFLGIMGLYRFFQRYFTAYTWLLVLGVWLFPSVLFYTSTIHKDGLILAGLGTVLYSLQQMAVEKKAGLIKVVIVITLLLLMGLLRSYVLAATIPALISGWAMLRWKSRRWWMPLLVYVFTLVLFFGTHRIFPAIDLPQFLVKKQAAFLALEKANTTVPLKVLQPTAESYLQLLPQAIGNSLCRPYLTDLSLSQQLLPFVLETLLLLLLIAGYILLGGWRQRIPTGIVVGWLITFACFLCIGYVVPILGAVVRYRSIYLPFIIVPTSFFLHTYFRNRFKWFKK